MPGSYRRRPLQGHVLPDERSERRLRRIRWRRLAAALLALAALGGLAALYLSPLLRVQQVQVVGTRRVDPQEVIALADLEGTTMLNPPLAEAAERIAALPLVKSAEAERVWPRTVRIRIVERAPWGVWLSGGRSYVIDSEGVVLPLRQPPPGAPLIREVGRVRALSPGDRVDADAVALVRALTERLPRELALGIVRIEHSPQDGLSVTTDAGYKVILGDSQNVEYKLAVWRAVEEELGREEMAGHVLDLRFHSRPSFSEGKEARAVEG